MNQRVVDAVFAAAEEDYTETFAAESALCVWLASTLVKAGDFLVTISAVLVLKQIQIDKIEQLEADKEKATR